MDFATKYVKANECFDVLFSGESKFNLFGCDRWYYVIKKGVSYGHGGGSVMVWFWEFSIYGKNNGSYCVFEFIKSQFEAIRR